MRFFAAGIAVWLGSSLLLSAQDTSQVTDFFQKTEQSLMDAIAVGDKGPWRNVMDDSCVVTNEEGAVQDKKTFLAELTPLPQGLSGTIKVTDLSVQNVGDFAIVRFRMDEHETVFGQQLATSYRSTDTFRNENGTWKMLASHQSVVTSDPPAQAVPKSSWPSLVGDYRLPPNGWTFRVVLISGQLYGGRDPKQLRRMIPLASNVFVREGTLGEWIFALDKNGRATKLVDFRKFEPLVWTRVRQ